MSNVELSEQRAIKASASYERITDLPTLSSGAQAWGVELVKRVPSNLISRMFQKPRELFVRKSYRLNSNGSASSVIRKYLWSEYEILSKLRHPNIVQYVDFECKERKRIFSASIYMEYCDGGDLSQYTSRHGVAGKSISEKQFWEIFYQLASALLYCHAGLRADDEIGITVDSWWRRPVLHRDVKPANVVISSIYNDRIKIKICDFGLAKYQCSTFLGSLVGTKGYIAPEITDEDRDWTPKADVYSLGKTMQSLICQTLTKTSIAVIKQCTYTDPKKRPNSASLFEITRRHSEDDDSGITLLHEAVKIDNLSVVNRLIEVGADPEAESKDGGTPLHYAANSGHIAIVNRLIEMGADPKAELKDGETPLHYAANRGHIAILNRLIEVGADPKAESKNGITPLHGAASNGHAAMVNRLIEVGADPNHRDNFDTSAFHYAVYHGRISILEQFLQSSGDPWLLDGFGHNVLDWAATYPPAFQAMGDLLNGYKPTDRATTLLHITKTVQRLLQSACRSSIWFNSIGRILFYAGDDSEATISFEQAISSYREDPTIIHEAGCDMCEIGPIQGRRHICQVCPDTDLCEPCFLNYSNGKSMRNCGGHSFLAIPSQTWKALQPPYVNEARETVEEWIERLKQKWNSSSLDTSFD